MGQETFDYTSDGDIQTFTTPPGVRNLTLCACGGGGGGGANGADDSGRAAGGYRGTYISDHSLDVVLDEVIDIIVGKAGSSSIAWGGTGGETKVTALAETLIMPGGNGGSPTESGYQGNGGGSITTCGGTFRDGYWTQESGEEYAFGGQAGCFGNGGVGGRHAPGAGPGGIGAGGGGAHDVGATSAAGGAGRVVVTWDDIIDDGGLLLNGTRIPEIVGTGSLNVSGIDTLGAVYTGPVKRLFIDGIKVWEAI